MTPAEEIALKIVTGELDEIAVTSSVVDRAIEIRRSARIKIPDAIIAATALETGSVLITRNADDFKSVASLEIFNPWDSLDFRT